MIAPDRVPIAHFDEAACLKYVEASEPLIDQQLLIPWNFGEWQRVVIIPNFADVRHFARLKQNYEAGKWVISDPFLNVLTGGYLAVFTRPLELAVH